MICENCGKEQTEIYASGRFCSNKCARSFSTKEKRKEINEKVSKKLKGIKPKIIATEELLKAFNKLGTDKIKEYWNNVIADSELHPWNTLGPVTRRKRLIIEQDNCCKLCGINEWNSKRIILRLDHIDGDRYNNNKENLRLICPNCDSQLPTYCGRNYIKHNISDDEILIILKKNNFNKANTIKELKITGQAIHHRIKYLIKLEQYKESNKI